MAGATLTVVPSVRLGEAGSTAQANELSLEPLIRVSDMQPSVGNGKGAGLPWAPLLPV